MDYQEWDSKGNQIYFDGSNGKIIDNRPKPCEDKIVESEDGIKCMVKINKNIMKTIGQQINWDFDRNDNLEIRDKNDNPIYFENRNGDWYKWRYDSNGNEIYHETFNGDWTKREYDSKNNLIYWEDSYGQWAKWEFDSNGNQIYHKDSCGYWSTREYDSNGNSIYFEDSNGVIKDNRPKNEITIDVSGIENSGKSRVIFLLKKLLKEQKFDVQFDGGRDFDDESHFDEYIEKRFDDILENIKPITKIVIKESHTIKNKLHK